MVGCAAQGLGVARLANLLRRAGAVARDGQHLDCGAVGELGIVRALLALCEDLVELLCCRRLQRLAVERDAQAALLGHSRIEHGGDVGDRLMAAWLCLLGYLT